MKWIYPPKESSSKWKPWHVPWYIDNPSAEWNGCHHWLRWLLSTERHLLLGNKLPGRHWSNDNTVYAALMFFASDHHCSSFQGLRQTQMLHREWLLFEGQTEAISVTSQTNERGRSYSKANKPSCPLQHLSKWDFQQ